MLVTSPAFRHNGLIPKKHTGFGDDLSPELVLEDVPEGTVSIAVVLDDLDVPFLSIFTHWIIWNISPTSSIPEGLPQGSLIDYPIPAVQGCAWGNHVYRGPKQPSFFRRAHRYRFSVYALDAMLDIVPDSNKAKLLQAMSGHLIEMAELVGVFNPPLT